jgi:hypothetical protein
MFGMTVRLFMKGMQWISDCLQKLPSGIIFALDLQIHNAKLVKEAGGPFIIVGCFGWGHFHGNTNICFCESYFQAFKLMCSIHIRH